MPEPRGSDSERKQDLELGSAWPFFLSGVPHGLGQAGLFHGSVWLIGRTKGARHMGMSFNWTPFGWTSFRGFMSTNHVCRCSHETFPYL